MHAVVGSVLQKKERNLESDKTEDHMPATAGYFTAEGLAGEHGTGD
jgi:hypothetical protein